MANKTNFFVVSLIAMMAVAPAVADTPATQEWTKGRYDTAMQTINSRLATDVRDKIYNYDTNKNSPTYRQILDPLHTEAGTAFSGINEVLQKVDGNDGTANSAETLETTAQNAFGAINELKDAIDNIDIPEQVQPDWNATTGKAAILNKPEIPAAQVQANWTQSDNTAVDYIKNKPTLATVATSGSYNDLDDKPTIPSIEGLATTQELTSGLAGKQNSLTEAQLAAANSGITAEKVASYDGYAATIAAKADASDIPDVSDFVTETDMNTALGGKQNSLTEAQLAAANSGITAEKVASYDGYAATIAAKADASDIPDVSDFVTETDMNTALGGKQNSLTEAQLAAANSGITAEKVASYDGYATTIAAKADAASLDDYVTEDALTTALADKANANIIGSGFDSTNTVAAALATKQNTLSFDATPTANSTNPVTSGGIYNAISAMSGDVASIGEQITDALEAYTTTADLEENYATKAELPTIDSALSTTSENAVQNKVVTNALNTKLTQTVGNAPAAGQYVLGYVDGVQTYIAIVDADGE